MYDTNTSTFFKKQCDFHFFISYFRTEIRNAERSCMINQRQRKNFKLGTNLTQKQPSTSMPRCPCKLQFIATNQRLGN